MEVVLDHRYEFFAPKYHDFTLEETILDIHQAEHWFETFIGYDDSPHAARKIAEESDSAEEQLPLGEKNLNVASIQPAENPLKGHCKDHLGDEEQHEHRGKENFSTKVQPSILSPLKQKIASKEQKTPGKSRPKEPSFVFKAPQVRTPYVHPPKEHRTPYLHASKEQRTPYVHPSKDPKTPFCNALDPENLKRRDCSTLKETSTNPSSPYVSLAERVLRFQIKTPERFRSQQEGKPVPVQQKPVLRLTVPKEPDFETTHRARPPRVKSTAELEEEMLAKLPKFKARPLNKKIFEGPALPTVPKSNPQPPEFEEFHLRTMERAMHHACASSSEPTFAETKQRRKSAPGSLTEPQLRTAARARPVKVKSSEEIEREELEKIPKFKARPLNKKIFESRGDLGILYRGHKRQRTVPQEFHFATDERFQRADEHPLLNKLEKLSLNCQELTLPAGPTRPEPFNLVTEQRGAMKEMKFMQELFEREMAERELRVPKAQPLPFTTDIPAIPPKPCPKECTRPEPFELESLVRHEEELQRKAEESARMEIEEAQMRRFVAQPIACLDHVFIPERSRKPLTEVQEFPMHVDSRAVERAEFDKKVTEKQNEYIKFREELEAARKVEEDKVVKALRKEMVPLARPMPIFGKPFVPLRSSREPTRGVAPKLRVLARKERRQSAEQRQSAERRRSLEQSRSSKNNQLR